MAMNWNKLLCDQRLSDPSYSGSTTRSIFVQDYDRIVFSAPFRRLANKTQVQPLYENDHVHHRLIHSVEVTSVGRSLAMKIGEWLEESKHVDVGTSIGIAAIVQAACVAHDIGNPPFGHSGEAAIGSWFNEKFDSPSGFFNDIDTELHDEFKEFEGNAQGFRILTRLEMYRNNGGMRLSKATLGAFTKYPVLAHSKEPISKATGKYVGLKKFGIFTSELEQFKDVAAALELPEISVNEHISWRRHPLVFIMEAADDICYRIVDLEDAFATGELPLSVVRDILFKCAGQPNRAIDELSQSEQISYLRALSIGNAIDSCVEAFKNNYTAIMEGSFSSSLIDASQICDIFKEMGEIALRDIFTAKRKTELEVSGRTVIRNVMSGIYPIFENLAANDWQQEKLSTNNIQLVRALGLDLRDVKSPELAARSIGDFTSGMTDRYAVRISRMLTGI